MSINSVTISGNLTADVVIRQTSTGTKAYNFGVAVNDRRRNQQTGEWEDVPNFVDCTMFDRDGKRAWIANCLRKGFKVLVHGRLQQDRWTDQQGNNRTALKVIVSDIDAQWPPRQDGGQQGYFQGVQPIHAQQQPQQQVQQQQQPMQQQYQQPVQQQPVQDMYQDDIPF